MKYLFNYPSSKALIGLVIFLILGYNAHPQTTSPSFKKSDLELLIGDWEVWIPGGFNKTVTEKAIYNTYNPGSAMNKLSIKADGKYVWGEHAGELIRVTPWHAEPTKSYYQISDRNGNKYDFWHKVDTDQLIVLFGEVGGHAATGSRLTRSSSSIFDDQTQNKPQDDQQKNQVKEHADDKKNDKLSTDNKVNQESNLNPNDAVEIHWSGQWYKGKILEVANGQYKVRYDGWGSAFDEWVSSDRLKAIKNANGTRETPLEEKKETQNQHQNEKTRGSTFKKGDKVSISWSGSWYKGMILEVKDGKYKVRYDGWGSAFDEWVDASRLKLE